MFVVQEDVVVNLDNIIKFQTNDRFIDFYSAETSYARIVTFEFNSPEDAESALERLLRAINLNESFVKF